MNINPKYLKGIVTYSYITGSKLMTNLYGIERHCHGPFDVDVADFKKFFAQVKNGGEVTEISVIAKKGCYHWDRVAGWLYFGK